MKGMRLAALLLGGAVCLGAVGCTTYNPATGQYETDATGRRCWPAASGSRAVWRSAPRWPTMTTTGVATTVAAGTTAGTATITSTSTTTGT